MHIHFGPITSLFVNQIRCKLVVCLHLVPSWRCWLKIGNGTLSYAFHKIENCQNSSEAPLIGVMNLKTNQNELLISIHPYCITIQSKSTKNRMPQTSDVDRGRAIALILQGQQQNLPTNWCASINNCSVSYASRNMQKG